MFDAAAPVYFATFGPVAVASAQVPQDAEAAVPVAAPTAAADEEPAHVFQPVPSPLTAVVGLTPFELADPVALDHWTQVLDASTFFVVEEGSTLAQVVGLPFCAEEVTLTVTTTVEGMAQAVQYTLLVV